LALLNSSQGEEVLVHLGHVSEGVAVIKTRIVLGECAPLLFNTEHPRPNERHWPCVTIAPLCSSKLSRGFVERIPQGLPKHVTARDQ
jgi:hypothetical protein